MKSTLDKLKQDYSNQLLGYKKRNHLYVTLRVILLVLFMITLVTAIKYISLRKLCMFIFIIILLAFILVYIKHEANRLLVNKYQSMIDMIERYYKRIDGEWKDFKDQGNDFHGNHFHYDLDIIGENSLFQFLNIAVTNGGRKRLFHKLSNQKVSSDQLINSQKAILELNQHLAFCIEFEQLINNGLNKNIEEQLDIMKNKTHDHKIEMILFSILSIVSIILGVLVLFDFIVNSIFIMYALILLALSLIYSYFYSKEFDDEEKSCKGLSLLDEIYQLVDNQNFQSELLKEISLSLYKGRHAIGHVRQINDLDSFRKNFLGYILSNIFFPLNSRILYLYHLLQNQSLDDLVSSVNAFEELEALVSLSVMGVCYDDVCLPVLNDNIQLSFRDIKHPLLTECIANDFKCDSQTVIITGSNMSGKTSFMRTIGMNLVLMYAGTYVRASFFQAGYMKIYTSMRVKDDIDKGISTFYGELLRIKDMMEEEEPFIGFIDEIFKGTNYNDRIYGASAIINRLIHNNILFITTHDFELCDLDNKRIVNYYFEEHYDGDNILFDYKIKAGKCKTTNARYLMKRLHILQGE